MSHRVVRVVGNAVNFIEQGVDKTHALFISLLWWFIQEIYQGVIQRVYDFLN